MNKSIKTNLVVILLEDIFAENLYQTYSIAQSTLHEIDLISSWFNLLCSKHNFQLINEQKLLTQRNKYCHQNIVF